MCVLGGAVWLLGGMGLQFFPAPPLKTGVSQGKLRQQRALNFKQPNRMENKARLALELIKEILAELKTDGDADADEIWDKLTRAAGWLHRIQYEYREMAANGVFQQE